MNKKGDALMNFIVFLVVMFFFALIGAFCWTYTINTWLNYFHKPNHINLFQGALLGVVPLLGQFSLPASFITWILMMFIG